MEHRGRIIAVFPRRCHHGVICACQCTVFCVNIAFVLCKELWFWAKNCGFEQHLRRTNNWHFLWRVILALISWQVSAVGLKLLPDQEQTLAATAPRWAGVGQYNILGARLWLCEVVPSIALSNSSSGHAPQSLRQPLLLQQARIHSRKEISSSESLSRSPSSALFARY